MAAIAVVLAANFFLPGRVQAQRATPIPSDVDSGKVQPLDLKPGCWQVRTRVVAQGVYTQIAYRQLQELQKVDNITPQQRAQMIAGVQATTKSAEESAAKGSQTTIRACTAIPFIEAGKEIYGTLGKLCDKTFQVAGEARHVHIRCPEANGDQITDDYDRIDSGNFKGVRHQVTAGKEIGPNGEHATVTTDTTWIGKWMGETSPHMPHVAPPTDLDGVTPVRPYPVAWMDPFRIVVVVDGKQIIAQQAYFMINRVTSAPPPEYHAELGLAALLQNIWLHYKIAGEAVMLHLDAQEPWRHQLNDAGGIGVVFGPDYAFFSEGDFEYNMDPETSENESTTNAEHHAALSTQPIEKILWNAYFSRAKTDGERQALLHRAQEKYKITVIDPDFFDGQKNP
jgi:hypothetical protein